jgi:hypothetical protein
MGIDSHLSTCVGTQSPKYLEMAQGHISLSSTRTGRGPRPAPAGRSHPAPSAAGVGASGTTPHAGGPSRPTRPPWSSAAAGGRVMMAAAARRRRRRGRSSWPSVDLLPVGDALLLVGLLGAHVVHNELHPLGLPFFFIPTMVGLACLGVGLGFFPEDAALRLRLAVDAATTSSSWFWWISSAMAERFRPETRSSSSGSSAHTSSTTSSILSDEKEKGGFVGDPGMVSRCVLIRRRPAVFTRCAEPSVVRGGGGESIRRRWLETSRMVDGGVVLRGRWFATMEMILAWPQQWGGMSVAGQGQVRASGTPSIEVSKGRRLRWRESRCGCAFYHAWASITAKGPHEDGGMRARIAAA